MKLGKPSIIQAWIEFRFEHTAESPTWGVPTALNFFERYKEEYIELETLSRFQVEIQKLERNQKPQVVGERELLEGIRGIREDRSRYLQLTQDTLVCNFLRTNDKGYEGFAALKKEALAKLKDYCEFFRPARLTQFALQYVDLVRIPFVNNRIELKDYFTIGQDLPDDTFGPTMSFLFQYATCPPNSNDLLEVRLWNERIDSEDPTGQFRMDWRLMGYDELSLAESTLGPRLDQAHAQLLDCFKKSFTTKAWESFDPAE